MRPRHPLARALPVRALLAAAALAAPALAARADTAFTITPAGRGAQRLDVPPAFLSASASGDLADLRLRDGGGREVPYLVVPPPSAEPRWAAAARVSPIPRTKTASGAALDLGAVREISALRVELPGPGFLKPARLEGSADGQRWTTLVDADVLYRLPQDACGAGCAGALERRELDFTPAAVRWLRLVLDDRRSPPLAPPVAAEVRLDGAGALPPPAGVPLRVEPRPGEPGLSRFALRLPGVHLPVRAIVLDVRAPRLSRRARVLEARLAGGRLTPIELGNGALVRVERDGVVVSDLRVPVSAPEEAELELVVEDGDSGPLALAGAHAELAPLPWLYFESDGSTITAVLGDPSRHAPRYDLEALRPELARLRPARATASGPGEAPAPQGPTLAADPSALAGAALDRRPFRWSRPIPAAPPGLAAVRLDAAVLARTRDLGELRILGPDGRQVPYLLEERDEPLVVPLAAPLPGGPPELARGGHSVRALALPEARLPGGRLVLETRARVFRRVVEVYAPAGRDRAGLRDGAPRRVASAAWASADPARPAPPLALELPEVDARELWLVLDDGDNAPLPVDAARLLLPSRRLRFFHPGPPLELLGGDDGLEAPRYDLALLAPRLRAAAARDLVLPAAPPGGEARPADAGGRLAFWIVLGAAVVVLLAVVARLVTRGSPPASGASGDDRRAGGAG